MNTKMVGFIHPTKTEKTNDEINRYAALRSVKLEKSNHSRGSMTESVSLQYTNAHFTKDGKLVSIPLEKVRFIGAAASAERYYEVLARNGYVNESSVSSTFGQATHTQEFVSIPLGWNSVTNGACKGLCYAHSGYYGKVPSRYLLDSNNKPILDKYGKEIDNPEYQNYARLWGYASINSSAPKIMVKDKDGNSHYISTKDGNGIFEYNGRKFYENIY